MDIDFKYIGKSLDSDLLRHIFNQIINTKNNDSILFSVLDVDDIRAETKYGGKNIRIEAKFFNIKKIFGIDIGVGDVVTPEPLNFKYVSSITNESFDILAYSIETAISEKFETLISKGVNNSRSKDLVDLYLLNKKGYDVSILNSALINTFYIRNTKFEKESINEILDDIFTFERTKRLYENYCLKNYFAKDISFENCKNAVYNIFENIKFKEKISLKPFNIELHIVRHGEDENDKVGGWSDNRLTENGINEIIKLTNEIDDNYDLFVSSDLNRTMETANILNKKLNMNIIFDNSFREVNNGIFKNMTTEEFLENHSNYIFSKLEMNQNYPGGESPIEFYQRIKENFERLLIKNKGKKILLVTHGGVLTVIYCLINGIEYSNYLKITQPTGSIIKYN